MIWIFLTCLLEEIHSYSTFERKICLTVLMVFRIVLYYIYYEQGDFVCNTAQPGCEIMCHNALLPLSHVRFWVFQIVLVATPFLMYLGYTIKSSKSRKFYLDRRQNRGLVDAEEDQEEDPMLYDVTIEMESQNNSTPLGATGSGTKARHDGRQQIQQDGLMRVYVVQLVIRCALEICFLIGQYMLYGFTVQARYMCSSEPCPHVVDCFVSRPTEKTVFLLIMYAVTIFCLLLTVWEMHYLGLGTMFNLLLARKRRHGLDDDLAENARGGYGGYAPSWTSPSAPPEYNIAVKAEMAPFKQKEEEEASPREHQHQYGSTEDNFVQIWKPEEKNRKAKQQHDQRKQRERERNKRNRSRGARGGSRRSNSKSDEGKPSVWI